MHSLSRLALCLVWGNFVLARAPHSLPEDIHAFPKYRVTFLNDLPVLNDTAEHWRNNGLHGGELEFLDRPWAVPDDPSVSPPERRLEGQEHPVRRYPLCCLYIVFETNLLSLSLLSTFNRQRAQCILLST
jgi:hypothetical protein